MHRKSHIYFAISISPLFFLLPDQTKLHSNIELINNFVVSYNNFIHFFYNNILDNPIKNIGLILICLILYILGSIFPDIDLKLKKILPKEIANKQYYYHRQFTHSVILWLGLLYFTLINFDKTHNILLLFFLIFMLGNITHLIGDMLTGTVPWLLYGHYGKFYSRIGITTFFPNTKKNVSNANDKSFMNYFFTRTIPNFLEKKEGGIFFIILFIINIYLTFKFKIF